MQLFDATLLEWAGIFDLKERTCLPFHQQVSQVRLLDNAQELAGSNYFLAVILLNALRLTRRVLLNLMTQQGLYDLTLLRQLHSLRFFIKVVLEFFRAAHGSSYCLDSVFLLLLFLLLFGIVYSWLANLLFFLRVLLWSFEEAEKLIAEAT